MAVTPIDLQTNMAQMTEVGRAEHARAESIAELQHLIKKESGEKSNLLKAKLDELKKEDKLIGVDKHKGKNSKHKERDQKENEKNKAEENDLVLKDNRMGKFIDVLK